MHMAHRAAAWVAWAVWTCNTPQQGIWSKESGLRPALFFCAPGRAHSFGDESPLHTRHGQVLAEGNGFSGDRESEGSRKQSAGATNRKRIEAAPWGEQAERCEARYMYGTRCRISDAHKREGGCAIPGEICQRAAVLRGSRGSRRRWQKSAEAIVGDGAEGPNNEAESRTDDLEAKR
jgi:hypothetical protein